MGRAPCCDKANVKKGPWSPEEDSKLKDYIEKNGTGGNWIALPQKAGLRRCGKSCRLRWLNYLRPNIRHGEFSEDEDRVICTLYATIGSRTDNDIKNYWNTKLKKKLMAYNAASSTTTCLNGTSFQETTTKPTSMYHSSSPSQLMSSLYSYSYSTPYNPNTISNSNSNSNPNTTKPLMDQTPFSSCHQMTSRINTTASCLETSLSLFQNQQYYQPLMFGSSADQQTSCSSNNSDTGGSCGNKQDMGSFQNPNNNNNNVSSSSSTVVIPNGFDEQDENKSFMLNEYEETNAFLCEFDNMNSSTDDTTTTLMDLHDIEDGNKQQLNMNISDCLSLINIDGNQSQQVINTKITSQDQPMIKDKDHQIMLTYYFNSNYCL